MRFGIIIILIPLIALLFFESRKHDYRVGLADGHLDYLHAMQVCNKKSEERDYRDVGDYIQCIFKQVDKRLDGK